MKNKIINRWGIIFSSVLSFFGIILGSFACVYGPPGDYEENQYRLNQLKEDVQKSQDSLNKKESYKAYLYKDLNKYKSKIKLLENERDSLLILLKEFKE